MINLLFRNIVFVLIIVFTSGLSLLIQGCKDKEVRHEDKKTAGITGITRGKVDLPIPPDTPPDKVCRYEIGYPFQVAPNQAALFCGIMASGTGSIDFTLGTDLILFDDLENIKADKAIPLFRSEFGESSVTVKGAAAGGFIPFGAKLQDGTPHPHAGTGFGLCYSILYGLDQDGHFDYREYKGYWLEFFQFTYDGKDFSVQINERMEWTELLPNWEFSGLGLETAIPDGSDLLFCMTAKSEDGVVSGVLRWKYGKNGWQPASFVPVTKRRDSDIGKWRNGGEPSLIRDIDGSLLFSARSAFHRPDTTAGFDIAVWRSTDNSETWKQIIYRKECRSRSPITINRAVDGTPFIAANLPPLKRTREVLCLWPLNEDRTDFIDTIIARDARTEFGQAPSGSWWRVDHPVSAILRLADGEWHSILTYHVVDNGEIEGDAGPTPQTGCYIEEVFSSGKTIPEWQF